MRTSLAPCIRLNISNHCLSLPQEVVEISVTSKSGETEVFNVYKSFICYHSAFFDAAFNGSFKEGVDQEMDLPDVEPYVFGMFVSWMYTGDIKIVLPKKCKTPAFTNYIYAWVFGDRIFCPRFQDDVLRLLDAARIELSGQSGPFVYLYENTTEESLLRQYIVDTRSTTTVPRNIEKYPKELLFSWLQALGEESRPNSVLKGPRGRFGQGTTIGRLNEVEISKYFVDEDRSQIPPPETPKTVLSGKRKHREC